MRFAVHGPGYPVASPRSHGVPRRDVDGRVHISIAGETAGSAPEHGLALTRVPVHLPARRAPLARQRGTDLLHPARGLVLQPAHQQAPARTQDARGSARPWRGRCGPGSPGCLSPTGSCCRSSGPRRGSRRTAARCPWTLFSAQSVRRSLSRARSRAIACLTRPRRFEPRFARASVRCMRRSLIRSRPVRTGQCSNSPEDRAAETATPRSMPTTWPLPGAGTGPGTTAKATCQRPARSIVTR